MTGIQDFIFYIKHIYHVPQYSTVPTEYSLLVSKPGKGIDTVFNIILILSHSKSHRSYSWSYAIQTLPSFHSKYLSLKKINILRCYQ